MSDEDDSAPSFAPYALQLVMQQVAGLSVKRGEGLVHQEDVGFGSQRAGDSDSLAHAAGKLVDVAVLELSQVYEAKVIAGLFFSLGR